jgi:hypothetical protein
MRRRAAVEPVIGHLKDDHRMRRNHLEGRGASCYQCSIAAVQRRALLSPTPRDILHGRQKFCGQRFSCGVFVRVRIRPDIETYGSAVRPSFSGGRLRAERRLATASHGGARGLKVVGSETRRVVSLI